MKAYHEESCFSSPTFFLIIFLLFKLWQLENGSLISENDISVEVLTFTKKISLIEKKKRKRMLLPLCQLADSSILAP